MDSTQLALLALLAGAVIGGSASAVVVAALRARDRVRIEATIGLPSGVRSVLHGMDDAALVVDASSTVVAASPPAAAFGLHEGEVLGDDDLKRVVRTARSVDAVAEPETLRIRRGPADERLVAVRATRIRPTLTLLVLRDITEKERVEQMRRDFVANTSHELKTPVGAVTLLAEAIESAADDPPQVRIFAERLTAEAARLALLTSRIMNLSRLQSSDDLTSAARLSVDEIVVSAIDAHAVQAASAGVTLKRGGTKGLYVRGDAQVLAEAVGNLIANAIVYSPQRSTVGIGVGESGGMVEIAVTDHGIGIAEEDLDRIFERFYRADQARSRRTGGSGLGLSIVKHAIQRHGGEVRVWSSPGRGSTFTVRLARTEPPADTVQTPARARPRKERPADDRPTKRPPRTRAAATPQTPRGEP